MREDKRPLAQLLWYAGGLIPLAGVALMWASTGDQMLIAQRTFLFIAGAAIGGCALLAAGEWIRPTNAQPPPPLPPVNGNCNVFGNDNVNCNTFIIQNKPPTVSLVGDLPPIKNSDGTFNLRLVFRIISQGPANSLTVIVKKADVIARNSIDNGLNVGLRVGQSIIMGGSGQNQDYIWQKIQTPTSGEYLITTRVATEDTKPVIQIQVE